MDLMDTSSDEVDLRTFVNAVAALQTVDLHRLQRRLNNEQDRQDDSIGYDENKEPETNYTELKKKYDELKAAQNDLNGEIEKHLETNKHLSNELENIRDELKKKNLAFSEKEGEILKLKLSVESADKNMKLCNQRLNECKDEMESKERSLQELQKEMENVKRSTNEELTRLKQHMMKQVSEENPNISDLSGHNSLSKLREMYSELYNKEWTNAFDVLTKSCNMDERKSIELLLKILWECSKHARDRSQSDMKMIEEIITGSSEEPTPECKRLLREALKHVDIRKAEHHLQTLEETLARCDAAIYIRTEKVESYSKKCFQLCWLMSIQDPPVVLYKDHQRGATLDTNMYKYYKHSGDTFDFVVLPALRFQNDGPPIVKGVAQTCSKSGGVSSFGRKDDKSLDRTIIEKKCEPVSSSDRLDKRPYVHQTREDDAVLSKSDRSPKETRSYSEGGGKKSITPKGAQVTDLTQIHQEHVFASSHDKERFKEFCKQVSTMKDQDLRRFYGTDFDRYYTFYINQTYGNYKFI